MIVTAMLAWYDEDPAILHRAVASLACIADRLVAVDGRWDLYPGASATSPPEQAETIKNAARVAGIQLIIDQGKHWSGQVEKRNHMLQLAKGSDWVLPLDADWELEGDRDRIRAELAAVTADTLSVLFCTPTNPARSLSESAATEWHANMAGTTERLTLIWRYLDDMRVEDAHWIVSGVKNQQRIQLWGNGKYPPAAHAGLRARFLVTHHCLHRDERTIQANREYCEQRAAYVAKHGREP